MDLFPAGPGQRLSVELGTARIYPFDFYDVTEGLAGGMVLERLKNSVMRGMAVGEFPETPPALSALLAGKNAFVCCVARMVRFARMIPMELESETDMNPEPPVAEAMLDLDFIPTWARRPATETRYAESRFAQEKDEPELRPGRDYEPRRRPRSDRRPAVRREAQAAERPSPSTVSERREAAVDIHFIPERRQLGVVVHRMHATRRAYPLSEVAHLFLKRPDFCQVKIESRRSVPDAPSLYQCQICQAVFLDREAALDHVVAHHADRWFEARETELQPPSGQFPCIVRSRTSGRLIGPPNHHLFAENLRRARDAEAPEMSMEEYRARLETVRDPELIEQWKREAARATLYYNRETPEAPPRTWTDVRAWILDKAGSEVVHHVSRAILPASLALELEDAALQEKVREAWARENRFPATLMFALRPALRHMGFHLFKADEIHTFVTAVAPSPLDSDRAIPPIRAALNHLAAHPGCTREQMVSTLFPERTADDPDVRALLNHLRWLVDKGHVIEFFDGSLSLPRHRTTPSAVEPAKPNPPHSRRSTIPEKGP